jgi:hypothetical protein
LSKELVLKYISSNDLYDFEASLLIEAVIKLNIKCEPIETKKHEIEIKITVVFVPRIVLVVIELNSLESKYRSKRSNTSAKTCYKV